MFERVEDDELRAYVVWGPMLGGEARPDAVEATRYLHDSRARHFWTGADAVAERFRAVAGLPEGELAWDTFLLYPPGARWRGEAPTPSVVMHVNKPLPEEQKLDAAQLREHVRALLDGKAASGSVP